MATKGKDVKGTGNHPNSKANLKPIKKGQLSKEEAKKRGRAGAKKSAERRQFSKSLRELAQQMLGSKVQNEGAHNELQKLFPDVDPESLSYGASMLQAQLLKAVAGDADAFRLVADYAGHKPADEIKVEDNRPKELAEPSKDKIKSVIDKLENL